MLEHTGLDKLDGFGPIYVINMERSTDRKAYIEEHFKKYNISNYNFVSGIDGSKQDTAELILNKDSIPITNSEAACTISHLRAIEKWLNESDSEYAIFVEDDVSFETTDYWNFSWNDFLNAVTKKYDILQLAIINTFKVNPRLHLRESLDWSAAAYLIKRDYAKKLILKHKVDNKYVLNTKRHLSISEGVLYSQALCYSIPLFSYSLDLGSSLNENHVDTLHKRSKQETMHYWKNNSIFKLDLI